MVFICLFLIPAYYLAEPGKDCEDTCANVNTSFACFNKINTYESKEIIEQARDPLNYTLSVDLMCSEAPDPTYSQTYHPSYNVVSQECGGYIMAPLKINCTAEDGSLDNDTRRLCYCVDKGREISD